MSATERPAAGEEAGPSLTILEASRATGLSVKALRRRVERGTLRAVSVADRRRIPLGELLRAGLLQENAQLRPARGKRRSTQPSEADRGTPPGYPAAVVHALLDRLERQAEEIGRLQHELEQTRRGIAEMGGDAPV